MTIEEVSRQIEDKYQECIGVMNDKETERGLKEFTNGYWYGMGFIINLFNDALNDADCELVIKLPQF